MPLAKRLRPPILRLTRPLKLRLIRLLKLRLIRPLKPRLTRLLTRLTAGADLDDLTDVGVWYCDGANAVSSKVLLAPAGARKSARSVKLVPMSVRSAVCVTEFGSSWVVMATFSPTRPPLRPRPFSPRSPLSITSIRAAIS